MWGATIGDIVSSRFERTGIKTKELGLLVRERRYTDDTVCTATVAACLLDGLPPDLTRRVWCHRRPGGGYGGCSRGWLEGEARQAYGSFGNGAAMRVSPAAYLNRHQCPLVQHSQVIEWEGAFGVFSLTQGVKSEQGKAWVGVEVRLLDLSQPGKGRREPVDPVYRENSAVFIHGSTKGSPTRPWQRRGRAP